MLNRSIFFFLFLPLFLSVFACGTGNTTDSSSLSSPPLLQEITDDNPGFLSVYLVLSCLRELGSYSIPGSPTGGGTASSPHSNDGGEDPLATCDYICEVKAEAEKKAELKYFLDELNTILDFISEGLNRCDEFEASGDSPVEGCAGFEDGQGFIVPIVDDFLQIAACD